VTEWLWWAPGTLSSSSAQQCFDIAVSATESDSTSLRHLTQGKSISINMK